MTGTGGRRSALVLAAALLLVAGLAPAASSLDVSTKALKVVASHEYRNSNVESYGGEVEGFTGELDGRGTAIAVLDTGVDDGHPTFGNAFAGGARYDASCNNGTGCMRDTDPVTGEKINPDDEAGHGTHVASIALGRGGSGVGSRGVAPGARLVDVKIANSLGGTTTRAIAEGIDWVLAYNNGNTPWTAPDDVRAIVLSFADLEAHDEQSYDEAMQAVKRATDNGVLVVAAAGNCGPDTGNVTTECSSGGAERNRIPSPGATPEALTVGAVDDNETIRRVEDPVAGYSSRGPNPADNGSDETWRKPDVVAPGTQIAAACHNGAPGPNAQEAEATDCNRTGTSMAAPHVAGVGAILWQAVDRLSGDDPSPRGVKDLITSTATDWAAEGWDPATGYGYVDGYRAVVAGTNDPPVSRFDLRPAEPEVDEQVVFDASPSHDPNERDDVERFEWTVDGAPVNRSGDQQRLQRTFQTPGNHTVTLTAVDSRGTRDPEPFRRTFHVSEPEAEEQQANRSPELQLHYGPDPVRAGQPAWFDLANSSDPDGDALVSFAWDFQGDDFDPDRTTDEPRTEWTYESTGEREVQVEVTDARGKQARRAVTLDVRPPPAGPPNVSVTNPQEGDVVEEGSVNVTWAVRENPAETFGVSVDHVAVDSTAGRSLSVNLTEGNRTISVKARGPGGSDVDQVNVTVVGRGALQQSSVDDAGGGESGGDAEPAPSRPRSSDEPAPSGDAANDSDAARAPADADGNRSPTEEGSNEAPGPGVWAALAALSAVALRARPRDST